MLEKITTGGKNAVVGLFLLGSAQCNPTYAQRDYNMYPAYRAPIAEHNVKAILNDICVESSVDPYGFLCKQTWCLEPSSDGCKTTEIITSASWSSFSPANFTICALEPHAYIRGLLTAVPNVGNPKWNNCDLIAHDQKQAYELSEALSIYMQERGGR